jgi:phosphoglycerol transferase MdoB-like AlkP superfamily enzyme
MNFEELQQAWQSQDAVAQATVNADALLKEVRRNQQQFRTTILWRDVREVGVAILLALFFLYQGMRHQNGAEYLLALAGFGVGAFMVVDRLLQRRKQPVSNDSLKSCIEGSLLQVNHQIWLLKNVFWWYLLPFAAALGISLCYSIWQARASAFPVVMVWVISMLFVALVYWGIYWLNQYAVRKNLEPRRQELESLLAGLDQ